MNDEALCDFMTRHRLPGGNYELPVDDWEKLSEADRLHLAERLKVQRHIPNHQTWTYSMPCAVLDGNGDSGPDTRFADVSERNTLDFDPEIEKTGHGRESYQSLIKADGRPLYAIDLLQEVLDNPEAFIDMLRPWLNSSTGDRPESVFQRQLSRWHDFGKWQNDNRGRQNDDDSFLAFVEQEKDFVRIIHQRGRLEEGGRD
ncbi:hypothetical protein CMUS01_16434 [Colletotrichum musicola]|uniref:Uncharacterized protein n=1 Tax=Colletotrichum musicola TaxID=2175873 RepID=A0A8H6INP5_9PEZI|nr:hypothetical protein CMUS01_16434 [Colletotrichum musicola]